MNQTLQNTYTCQVCKEHFQARQEEEFLIIPEISPLCSTRCIFKLYYRIFSGYEEKKLVYLAELLKIEQKGEIGRTCLIFEITKKYPKLNLSYINQIGTRDRDKKIETKSRQKNRDRDNTCLCNRHVVPIFVPKSNGGLSKWL